jgi:hypothetical protein
MNESLLKDIEADPGIYEDSRGYFHATKCSTGNAAFRVNCDRINERFPGQVYVYHSVSIPKGLDSVTVALSGRYAIDAAGLAANKPRENVDDVIFETTADSARPNSPHDARYVTLVGVCGKSRCC